MKEFEFDSNIGIYIHPNKPPLDYRDGGEDYLLDLFKDLKDVKGYSPELAHYIKDWPTMYHLSSRRTNLLEAISELFENDAAVLELGAGCGALTVWLGEHFRSVDAVEGSRIRAVITKERAKSLSNVNVYNADIMDTTFDTEKYGLITAIGVIEYIPYYNITNDPESACIEFIKGLYNSLEKKGVFLMAIENKLGAKYFTGCTEDHTRRLFDGLIGYPDKTPITFSKYDIEKMLTASGFKNIQFYHIFPDYKLPETVFRESQEALSLYPYNWIRTPFNEYSGARVHIIPEPLLLKTLAESRLLWEFSNSFLVLASKSQDTELKTTWLIKKFFNAEKFNNLFHHTLTLNPDREGNYIVERNPLYSGRTNVEIGDVNFSLTKRDKFVVGELLIYDVYKGILSKDPLNTLTLILKIIHDNLLSHYSKGEMDEQGYYLVDGCTVDYTFWNLIKTPDGGISYIDRKWHFRSNIPADFVLYRNLGGLYVIFGPFINEKNFAQFAIPLINKIYPNYNAERLEENISLQKLFEAEIYIKELSFELPEPRPKYSIVEQMQNLKNEIQSKGRQIREQDEQIREQDEQIREQDEQIREQDGWFFKDKTGIKPAKVMDDLKREKNKWIMQKDKRVKELETELSLKDATIQRLINSKSWKITMPLRAIYSALVKIKKK